MSVLFVACQYSSSAPVLDCLVTAVRSGLHCCFCFRLLQCGCGCGEGGGHVVFRGVLMCVVCVFWAGCGEWGECVVPWVYVCMERWCVLRCLWMRDVVSAAAVVYHPVVISVRLAAHVRLPFVGAWLVAPHCWLVKLHPLPLFPV